MHQVSLCITCASKQTHKRQRLRRRDRRQPQKQAGTQTDRSSSPRNIRNTNLRLKSLVWEHKVLPLLVENVERGCFTGGRFQTDFRHFRAQKGGHQIGRSAYMDTSLIHLRVLIPMADLEEPCEDSAGFVGSSISLPSIWRSLSGVSADSPLGFLGSPMSLTTRSLSL